MKPTTGLLFAVLACAAIAALLAGCTAATPPAANATVTVTIQPAATPSAPGTGPATSLPAVSLTLPAPTGGPGDDSCSTDSDCVPRECCHPTSCVNQAYKHVCTLMCTDICMGPVDCGAGHCGCASGKCAVQPGPAP